MCYFNYPVWTHSPSLIRLAELLLIPVCTTDNTRILIWRVGGKGRAGQTRFKVTQQPLSVSLDPAYQQKIPDLDGGEGSSEYIIHGTNVDISDPPAEAEQQEREEGGERAEDTTAAGDEEEDKTKDGTVEGEKEKAGENAETDQQAKESGEVANEQVKEEETAAGPLDVDSSDAGQAKL